MSLLQEAKDLKDKIIEHRRYLHENAEIGLELPLTSAYVKKRLEEMGYKTETIGTSGIVAIAGSKKEGKTFLMRGDMDALPIVEESDIPFKSKTQNMHACGHDFHTSMLLGAAQLLKNHEDEIEGQVKLMFQPAEEIAAGAKMMIENGVLENPKVDAAMMIHVVSGMPLPTGIPLFTDKQPYSAIDAFNITVKGKGCHGAIPDIGIDPLNVLSHIHIALQAINSREVSPTSTIALTVGEMHGGNTFNVIPDTAYMTGTIRTFSNETRDFARSRLEEIANGIASTFRASVEISYELSCPSLTVDEELQSKLQEYTEDMLGKQNVLTMDTIKVDKPMVSEDFAYVSVEVPTACIALGAGSINEGYVYPLHHPKVSFNEEALPIGAAIYANSAIQWLKSNK